MGLDISVVANLSRINPQPDEDEGSYGIHIFRHPHFGQQADDLETGYYEGEYVTSFRAGSYSGYNEWREKLCHVAFGIEPDAIWENSDNFKGKPFVELINFTDCEGTIGPKTSEKLYQDFLAYNDIASQYKGFTPEEEGFTPEEEGFIPEVVWHTTWFYDRYKEWMEAFRIASTQNGAILFH